MKALFFINTYNVSSGVEYKIRRLKEVLDSKGIESAIASSLTMPFQVNNDKTVLFNSGEYDFCIFLDKDRYYAQVIEKSMPIFNSSKALEICDDKMLTYLYLTNHGIPMIKTIPAPLCYLDHLDDKKAEQFIKLIEKEFTFPLVAKKCYGSLGMQVYLIHNHEELVDIYHKLYAYPHIYQEYMSYEFGTDYRLMVIGNKVRSAIKRKNDLDFRSNIHLGGVGTIAKLPESFYKLAEKASELIGLDYAGIDILKDNNGNPILSEINSNAFFSESEKVSKVDLSTILIEHILSKIK